MTKHFPRLAVATLAFSLGLAFVGALSVSDPHSSATPPESDQPVLKTSAIVQTVPVAPCPASDSNEFPNLAADTKWRSIQNGFRLPLKLDEEIEYEIDGSKFTPISRGRVLIGYSDSLEMRDSAMRTIWRFDQDGNPIFDFVFIEATNLVYVTAGDGLMFILSAVDGSKLFKEFLNGKAAFGAAARYKKDQCLITGYAGGYRENIDDSFEPMKDSLTAWRGTEVLWSIDFPPDAELIVNGDRILAVTKTKTGIYVKEIKPPM